MFKTQTLSDIALFSPRSRRTKLDLVGLLFLISAFLAPIELLLVASFTVYDALILVLAFLILLRGQRLHFLPRRFMVAIYFFLLFALLSTFRATVPIESLTQILQFAFIFFIQLPVILTLIRSQWILRMSLLLFMGGMLVVVVGAVVFNQVSGSGRAIPFFGGNPNALGYPMAYLLPFGLYLMLDMWHRRRLPAVVLGLPLFYLVAWTLAASGSRSSALGTLLALLVFLPFYLRFEINLKTILRLVMTLTVIGALSYWFYQSNHMPITLRYRIEQTIFLDDSFINSRLDLALAGWRAFLKSPFIGVGLDNFRYVANEYVSSAPDSTPHNIWLQLLAQVGLFGTLAFLTLITNWFVLALRTHRATNNRSQRELLWAFAASMVAIMAIFMVVPLMLQRQYWLVYGLGLAIALGLREDQVTTPADEVFASPENLNHVKLRPYPSNGPTPHIAEPS